LAGEVVRCYGTRIGDFIAEAGLASECRSGAVGPNARLTVDGGVARLDTIAEEPIVTIGVIRGERTQMACLVTDVVRTTNFVGAGGLDRWYAVKGRIAYFIAVAE
jgi:hypothetical protein